MFSPGPVCSALLAAVLIVAPPWAAAGIDESALVDALSAYLAERPIENHLLQPESLPDDPGDEFFLVFDVRTPAEITQMGSIPGAIKIEYDDLETLLERIGLDRSQPVLVYCQTVLRSSQTVMALRLLGYDNAWFIAGGVERWKGAGKPLE